MKKVTISNLAGVNQETSITVLDLSKQKPSQVRGLANIFVQWTNAKFTLELFADVEKFIPAENVVYFQSIKNYGYSIQG